ncbi:hypothetical protein NLJ89_g2318 [Agrocybe chaxingu]|uniref:Uncharacterized protein n=1 Tax=Agrocybe chaxingu TaxID=84603 RepID=A0A9W8MXR0_9AGAR|nr:hypothetical protein NLJ89_g2318 [Agrocybe chaxingu]
MHPTGRIRLALYNILNLYFHRALSTPQSLALMLPIRQSSTISVPDSGYASAENEGCEGPTQPDMDTEIELCASPSPDRAFAIKRVRGFVARFDVWVCNIDIDFPCMSRVIKEIHVQLNDAPFSKDDRSSDRSSVELQNSGGAVFFAERVCANPGAFYLPPSRRTALRILELDAGTGIAQCRGRNRARSWRAGLHPWRKEDHAVSLGRLTYYLNLRYSSRFINGFEMLVNTLFSSSSSTSLPSFGIVKMLLNATSTFQNEDEMEFRNPYFGLDELYAQQRIQSSVYPKIVNKPKLAAQISSAEPDKVFPVDLHRWLSDFGRLSPPDRRLQVSKDIHTIIQHNILDYGMEKCAITI